MGFKSFSTADFLHNLLSATHPDTVPASPVAGDLIFGNATPAWQRLGIGAELQVLTVAGGVPQWANPSVFVADYYFTDDAADVATYKYMQTALPAGAKTSVAVLIDSADNVPKTIQNWITPVGFPHTTFIPQGTWTVHFHAAQLTGSEDNRVTVELYKRTVGNVETLLGIAGPSSIIDQSTEVEYDVDASIPDTILLTTDRIVARVRSTPLGGGTNGTVTIYYRGATATRLGFPVSATSLDHGTLLGLADDDHLQYALLAGRAGGQTLYGGNAANDDLTLEGTAHATKTTSYVSVLGKLLLDKYANSGGIYITTDADTHVLVLGMDTGVNPSTFLSAGGGGNIALTDATNNTKAAFYVNTGTDNPAVQVGLNPPNFGGISVIGSGSAGNSLGIGLKDTDANGKSWILATLVTGGMSVIDVSNVTDARTVIRYQADGAVLMDGSLTVGLGTGQGVPKFFVNKFNGANDTVLMANAEAYFGDSNLGAGLLLQQTASAPYYFVIQAQNPTNGSYFPLKLNPLGGNINMSSLPTAAAGLAAGDLWVDTTGGLNIVKRV